MGAGSHWVLGASGSWVPVGAGSQWELGASANLFFFIQAKFGFPLLTLKGPEGGTLCPPFVIKSNNSIKLLIKRMEAQCKFIFACLGPKEKSQSVLSVSV